MKKEDRDRKKKIEVIQRERKIRINKMSDRRDAKEAKSEIRHKK